MTNRNIIIAEDDVALRSVNKRYLEKHSFDVDDFQNAGSALENFRRNPNKYGLVITDNRMPDINDGLRLAKEIYLINPVVPVFLCTGTPGDFIGQYVPENIKRTFLKPVSLSGLLKEIESCYIEN